MWNSKTLLCQKLHACSLQVVHGLLASLRISSVLSTSETCSISQSKIFTHAAFWLLTQNDMLAALLLFGRCYLMLNALDLKKLSAGKQQIWQRQLVIIGFLHDTILHTKAWSLSFCSLTIPNLLTTYWYTALLEQAMRSTSLPATISTASKRCLTLRFALCSQGGTPVVYCLTEGGHKVYVWNISNFVTQGQHVGILIDCTVSGVTPWNH